MAKTIGFKVTGGRLRIFNHVMAAVSITICANAVATNDDAYLGLGLPVVSIDGDFKGETIISGGGSAEIIPKLDAGSGFAVTGGYQTNGTAYELSITSAKIDAGFADINTTADYFTFALDVKKLFLKDKRFSPYVVGGMGLRSLDVKDGSTDGVNVSNAKFKGGVEWRLGVGVDLVLHRKFHLDIQGLYRFSEFTEVDAIASGELGNNLDSGGTTFLVSLNYRFDGD